MGGAPRTVKWRGIDTDPESAHCWETAAVDPDLDDILVRPILGYGSYRSNAASAGTDSGGGHVDINLEGLTEEQCRRMETVFRRYGNAAWWRPRINPATKKPYGWQNHLHVLRIDAVDLSGPARTQVQDYLAGWSGLPIGGRVLKDTGSRAYTAARWAAIKKAALTPTTPTSQEDDMALTPAERKALIDDIAAAVWNRILTSPREGVRDTSAQNWVKYANLRTADTLAAVGRNAGQVAGLATALQQVATGQGIDMAAITAAAEKGAREGVAESIDSIDVVIRRD